MLELGLLGVLIGIPPFFRERKKWPMSSIPWNYESASLWTESDLSSSGQAVIQRDDTW